VAWLPPLLSWTAATRSAGAPPDQQRVRGQARQRERLTAAGEHHASDGVADDARCRGGGAHPVHCVGDERGQQTDDPAFGFRRAVGGVGEQAEEAQVPTVAGEQAGSEAAAEPGGPQVIRPRLQLPGRYG
jgi:hypothetical protein